MEAQSNGVDKIVARRMAETRTPGMAVAVVVAGKVVHKKGYGVANLEMQSKVTERTVFNLASITKSFTALAAMKLIETGKITLDDPLSRHLENIPADWTLITIRQLLNNTSGIKSFTSLAKSEEPCNSAQDIRTYQRGDAIKEVDCFPLEFVPGEKWKYADTGFYLVGMVIEKVSGQDYGTFHKGNIFSPLGMRNTKLLDYSEIVPQRANGYSFRNGRILNASRFDIDEFANGGLTSTLEDMIRFEQAFLSVKVLKKSSIETMLSNARLNNGEIVQNYGTGIGLTPYKGQKRFGHTGGGGLGFATAFTHFPDKKITVVVLANADQEGIGDFANAIAELYFKRNSYKGEKQ
ncbi:MAG TPA: serine hydrolase domain-containing protein [Pyrinomonadaceae bacterium]|nr:serine hydrolase domain-containing protein [Pyrinomonadaceae bacterium]